MNITYLDTNRVRDVRTSAAPRSRSRTGYGNKIGMQYEILLDDNRWRRVYVILWSNVGSPYVLIKGARHFLGAFDPREFKKGSKP